jgi:REP element-mobilizing transposase RayT
VIVRGNHRRDIFRDRSDRVAYLERIEHYRERYRCIVNAYVLMSNHVHLLIQTGAVGLSKISSRLGDNGVGLNNLYNVERS